MQQKSPINDVTLSIRLPKEINEILEAIAEATDRSRNYLVREAITRYLATEADMIANVREGLLDITSGSSIPHEAVMRRAEKRIGVAKHT